MGTRRQAAYNASGNILSEVNRDAGSALLRRKTYTYDTNGNRLSETLYRTEGGVERSYTTSYSHDPRNRVIAVTDPLGNVSRTEYNALGRVAARIDALGHRTVFSYDEVGALTRTDHPDGTFETRT